MNAAFGLLAIIGVVVDPTTAGIKDSQRVMEKLEDNK
ncbi:phage holin [Lactococcus petauri]